jgi:hypothetical protein
VLILGVTSGVRYPQYAGVSFARKAHSADRPAQVLIDTEHRGGAAAVQAVVTCLPGGRTRPLGAVACGALRVGRLRVGRP